MHSTAVVAAKTQFTLKDAFDCADEEPRILELLPGIILYQPTMIKNLRRDLALNVQIQKSIELMLEEKLDFFFGIPAADCLKQARIIKKISEYKSCRDKTKNLNIRVSELDLVRLTGLARLQQKSKSDVIRDLLNGAV